MDEYKEKYRFENPDKPALEFASYSGGAEK